MRIFNAKSVVVLATLAAASAAGWAKVSVQQGNHPSAPVAQLYAVAPQPAQAHYGLQQVSLHVNASLARKTVAGVAEPAPFLDRAPEQEKANMGMMILVGLGMVGTVMFKNKRT